VKDFIALIRDAFRFVSAALSAFNKWLDNDKRTTALACFLGYLITTQVDWAKALDGNSLERGKVIGAVVVVWQGYLTNRLPTIKP